MTIATVAYGVLIALGCLGTGITCLVLFGGADGIDHCERSRR